MCTTIEGVIQMNYKKILFGCLLATILAVPVIKSYGFIGIGIGPVGIGAGYNPGYYDGYYYNGYSYPRSYYAYPGNYYGSPRQYYGSPRYQYPVNEGYYQHPQEAVAMAMPSDIQGMVTYVATAMKVVMGTDPEMIQDAMKQKDLMQHEGVVMRLGHRFDKEYHVYLSMFQSNDPNLSAQENKLKSVFDSFKAQYESFVNESKQ